MKESFLERAKENLKAADALFEHELYNASANRAYYAVFHAALVKLLEKGLEPAIEHKVVLSMFTNEFINRNKIYPSKLKEYLYEMQDKRNKAEYKNGISKKRAYNQLKMMHEFFQIVFKDNI